jgi:hypothetical protein
VFGPEGGVGASIVTALFLAHRSSQLAPDAVMAWAEAHSGIHRSACRLQS